MVVLVILCLVKRKMKMNDVSWLGVPQWIWLCHCHCKRTLHFHLFLDFSLQCSLVWLIGPYGFVLDNKQSW